jgi:ribosomal protein L12E/L44/L45/RPP1/RPP2
MPAFPFTTKIFRTIRRFDAAFSALLNNANNEIGSRSTVSMTEKVRMRSLVEETRVNAVNTASASGRETRVDDLSDDDDDEMELDHEEEDEDEIDDDKTALALSKIYKSTLEILGDRLTE